jgi:transcription antitermination factor NusG
VDEGTAKSQGGAGERVGATTGPLPQAGSWYVLHVRSRQEKLLADELTQWEIGHFLPLVRQNRLYGKRKAVVELPLFPSYMFLRGSRDDAYRANGTKRVARIIDVADQQTLTSELTNLHLALSGGVPLDPYPYLKDGVRVEVRSGPLRGLQGVIEGRGGTGRLILQVEMLGRAVSIEVPGTLLEPI